MLNTKLRTAAKNKFEKDSFKVINNSVFGNTMENIRNHKDTNLVTSQAKRILAVEKGKQRLR